MAFAAVGTNNKMEARFSDGAEQVLRDLFYKEVYANFELRDPRQMKMRFGQTDKKYTTHVPLGPKHKQKKEPTKPRPTGKAKGKFATAAADLTTQQEQMMGSSLGNPQHTIGLADLNAGMLRDKFDKDRADKAELGMYYSKAEYQELEKAAASRPQQVRSTRKVNASMRKKMSEKDAVHTMKVAREEGRAAPTKIVGLMRDWLQVERLQWDGCCAIWLAASDNAQAREDLGSIGAADVLVKAMQEYPDSEQIVERACWAMTALTYDNKSNAALLGRPACAVVAEALRMHRESVLVTRRALATVSALCKYSDENRQAMRELNVDDTLRVEYIQNNIVQQRSSAKQLRTLAVNALRFLEDS